MRKTCFGKEKSASATGAKTVQDCVRSIGPFADRLEHGSMHSAEN